MINSNEGPARERGEKYELNIGIYGRVPAKNNQMKQLPNLTVYPRGTINKENINIRRDRKYKEDGKVYKPGSNAATGHIHSTGRRGGVFRGKGGN